MINQGEISDSSLYLISEGAVGITVRQPNSNHEETVALRTAGDLVGEMTFLERSAPRTASIQVASPTATFVKISKLGVFELIRRDPSLQRCIAYLWELAASRRKETIEVLDGRISVENRVMSVILSDIHNFTALGEATLEEQSNAFLFEFMEESEALAAQFDASLEDQGDGHKIVVRDADHVERAIKCAAAVTDVFLKLRGHWIRYNDAFDNIGLGVGICTDVMSIRRMTASQSSKGRILSHAINIAAAMSKFRASPSEIEIFIDENTASMAGREGYVVEGPNQKWLERLGRIYPIYRVVRAQPKPAKSAAAAPEAMPDRKVGILFLSAEPTTEAQLRLAKEAREIEGNLRAAKFRDRFSFDQMGAVRTKDFSQAMLDLEPQIVHFSGHGTSKGGLQFEDNAGEGHVVSPQALAAFFREFTSVQCVVLNACYSAAQAVAISEHVDYVIGMDDSVDDDSALAFSTGLYQAIGAGKTIDEAYRLGCAQVHLQSGTAESLIPVLKRKKPAPS